MAWSDAGFGEPAFGLIGKTFPDASIFYRGAAAINDADLQRCSRATFTGITSTLPTARDGFSA